MAKQMTHKVFSKEICNTGRQIELDIGKALPILCLPFVHCIIECCTDDQLLSGIPYLFDSVIGGPLSAPLFLFCMGATIHYSRISSPGGLAKRGLKLIGFGFLLNICRFLIPFLIGYSVTGDAEKYLVPLPFWLFGNDVLMFAGVAFACLALMIKLRIPKWLMFVIALIFSVGGTCLRGTDLGGDVLNIIGGWFIGTVNAKDQIVSDFPLLNWMIIPTCGYIFGWLLRRVQNKKRFYLYISPAMLVVAAAGFIFGINGEIGMFGEGQNAYYHLYTHDAFLCIAATLGLLGVYYAISHILPKAILRFFSYISRNITKFYCIHWVYVRLITNVILYAATGSQYLPIWATMLISFGILLLTIFTLYAYPRILLKDRKTV